MDPATTERLTLAQTVEALKRRGFSADFEPAPGGVRVPHGERTYRPEELTIREYYRFEGLSDPDDMSVVYAIEAADGTRGVIVDAFGTYADPALGSVLRKVPLPAEARRGGPSPDV